MPRYMETPTEASVRQAGTAFGYPLMLKAKRMAYDGKGNAAIMNEVDRLNIDESVIPACDCIFTRSM